MIFCKILTLVALAISLTACSGGPRQLGFVSMYVPKTSVVHAPDKTPITVPNGKAGNVLASQMNDKVNPASPIKVGKFVSLEKNSMGAPLGKVMAIQLSDSLTANGYTIVLGNKLPVRQISENATVLTPAETLPGYALHGTYVPATEVIFVSASVVRMSDSAVMAAHDWVLPINSETIALLGQDASSRSNTPVVSTMLNGKDSAPIDQPPTWPESVDLYR